MASYANIVKRVQVQEVDKLPHGFVVLKKGTDYKNISSKKNTQNTQNTQQQKRMEGKISDYDVDEILFKDEILSELFEKISCVCNDFQNEVLLTDRPMLIENLNRCMWGVLQPHITMEAYDDYVECEDYDDNESFVSSND